MRNSRNTSRRLAAAILLGALLPSAALQGGDDSLYIWKRVWTKGVKEAVEAEKDAARLFFLAGEFDKADGTESYAEASPSWDALKKSGRPATPVYRVRAALVSEGAALAEPLAKRWNALAKEGAQAGLSISSIQVDLDCPESKLEDYARLLALLRKALPEKTELSATAIPCHLRRKAFEAVAEEADFFVLQVHGLDFPKDKAQEPKLIDAEKARESVKLALALKRPFLLALPCYAYQANYSKADGSLLFISAEDIPPARQEIETRIVAPDLQELAGLVKFGRSLEPSLFKGIVWFRLPVKGDRLCLDRASLSTLERGEKPEKILKGLWTKTQDGQIIFSVESCAAFGAGPIEITLQWPSGIRCDFDFFNGFQEAGDRLPGLPPGKITGHAPPPGVRTAVAWFRFPGTFLEPLVEMHER